MEQPMPMIPDYRIVQAPTLDELESKVDVLIKEGGQINGDVHETKEGVFFREMIFLKPDQAAIDAAQKAQQDAHDRFRAGIDNMDPRVRDLLDINNIELVFDGESYYTKHDGKVETGIGAPRILELLKGSKHYPVDMDDQTVLTAIEGVV